MGQENDKEPCFIARHIYCACKTYLLNFLDRPASLKLELSKEDCVHIVDWMNKKWGKEKMNEG